MRAAPCGCDLREKAHDEKDARAAAVFDTAGVNAQRVWRCPRVTKERSDEPLPEACQTAITAVHRLVGADVDEGGTPEFTTCPCYYARVPEAYEAVRLLPLFRKSQLTLRIPHPSDAVLTAIEIVETALAQREADELRRMRERAESESKSRK